VRKGLRPFRYGECGRRREGRWDEQHHKPSHSCARDNSVDRFDTAVCVRRHRSARGRGHGYEHGLRPFPFAKIPSGPRPCLYPWRGPFRARPRSAAPEIPLCVLSEHAHSFTPSLLPRRLVADGEACGLESPSFFVADRSEGGRECDSRFRPTAYQDPRAGFLPLNIQKRWSSRNDHLRIGDLPPAPSSMGSMGLVFEACMGVRF
jgi:hypothetical protein